MNGYSDSGSAINSKSYTSMNNGNGNGNSNGNGHGHATERHRQNSLEQDMLDDLAQHERGDSVNSLGDDNEGMHKGGGVTSSQARRDQNRIAQREFRARKQQHVSQRSSYLFSYRYRTPTPRVIPAPFLSFSTFELVYLDRELTIPPPLLLPLPGAFPIHLFFSC